MSNLFLAQGVNSFKNSRVPCVIANWKMNGTKQTLSNLFNSIVSSLTANNSSTSSADIVICPPFVYLDSLSVFLKERANSKIKLGAQNMYCANEGAFTGEISPLMLKDLGCTYVLLGHSERRLHFKESDSLIAKKWHSAYNASLIPVLCVGETREQRDQGLTMKVIEDQLKAVFEAPSSIDTLKTGLIAYEPVWAIGTGLTATPDEAESIHAFIRDWVKQKAPSLANHTRILYGGSVKAANAKSLMSQLNIDGLLVGGASLNAQEFVEICSVMPASAA